MAYSKVRYNALLTDVVIAVHRKERGRPNHGNALVSKRVRAQVTWEQFQGYLASMTHGRRVMALKEVANVAAFMASDQASGMTGTTVNLTMGGVVD